MRFVFWGVRRSWWSEWDGPPVGWLVWRRSLDGRAWLVSPANPLTLAWWAADRLGGWLLHRLYYPVMQIAWAAHVIEIPEAVCHQLRDWRTFSLRPSVLRDRHHADISRTIRWHTDEIDRLRKAGQELVADYQQLALVSRAAVDMWDAGIAKGKGTAEAG